MKKKHSPILDTYERNIYPRTIAKQFRFYLITLLNFLQKHQQITKSLEKYFPGIPERLSVAVSYIDIENLDYKCISYKLKFCSAFFNIFNTNYICN